jgi:hypothetical protein
VEAVQNTAQTRPLLGQQPGPFRVAPDGRVVQKWF